jgi:methylated-DNA-[protein]-cysteine S-methyltransferase
MRRRSSHRELAASDAVPALAGSCLTAVHGSGICAWIAWLAGPPFMVVGAGVAWAEDGPLFPSDALPSPMRHPEAAALASALRALLDGDPAPLPIGRLSLARLSPIARQVLITLRETTAAGQVTTYGALAAACGRPKAARAIGNILGHNPFPLFFPCHRVIPATGKIGGFQGGAEGTPLKARLIALEQASLLA